MSRGICDEYYCMNSTTKMVVLFRIEQSCFSSVVSWIFIFFPLEEEKVASVVIFVASGIFHGAVQFLFQFSLLTEHFESYKVHTTESWWFLCSNIIHQLTFIMVNTLTFPWCKSWKIHFAFVIYNVFNVDFTRPSSCAYGRPQTVVSAKNYLKWFLMLYECEYFIELLGIFLNLIILRATPLFHMSTNIRITDNTHISTN